ncbi:hypothetical protein, partial [Hydrogenispora ethanolica]|uniref:hypothetical protein n=1 Tax=Hydrogenispora ethanolica TaxID=1082276 RepID=UPI001A9F88AF
LSTSFFRLPADLFSTAGIILSCFPAFVNPLFLLAALWVFPWRGCLSYHGPALVVNCFFFFELRVWLVPLSRADA